MMDPTGKQYVEWGNYRIHWGIVFFWWRARAHHGWHKPQVYVIDAYVKGNVGRFLNHACGPSNEANVSPTYVFVVEKACHGGWNPVVDEVVKSIKTFMIQ